VTYKLLHIRVFFRALTIASSSSSSSSSYRNRLHRSGHICWDMDLGAGDSEMVCICGAFFSGIWTRVSGNFLLPPSIQSLSAAAVADRVFLGGRCSMDVGRDGASQLSSMSSSAAGSPPAPNKVTLITYKRRTGSASRMRYILLSHVVSYSAAASETCHLLSRALSGAPSEDFGVGRVFLWLMKKILRLVALVGRVSENV
jgi:hypothetical protein